MSEKTEKKVLSEMTLGERIILLRELHGWSNDTLAARADLNANRVAEIALGCDLPYAFEIVKIADALGVSLNFIAGRIR